MSFFDKELRAQARMAARLGDASRLEAILEGMRQQWVDEWSTKVATVQKNLRAIILTDDPILLSRLKTETLTAISEIKAFESRTLCDLELAKEEQESAQVDHASFLTDHQIDRPLLIPNLAFSSALLATLCVIEGSLLSAFFLSGGSAPSIGAALGFGLGISAFSVGASLFVGGHLCGRYFNYALAPDADTPTAKRKRWAGRIGSVVTAAALVGFHALSAVVRTSGDFKNISFDVIALGEAFSDYSSVVLFGSACLISIFSWWKGLSSFSDPYPGYLESSLRKIRASENAQESVSDALAEIADVADDAREDIDGIVEEFKEHTAAKKEALKAVGEQIISLHKLVSDCRAGFQADKAKCIASFRELSSIKPKLSIDGLNPDELFRLIPEMPEMDPSGDTEFMDQVKNALEELSDAQGNVTNTITGTYRDLFTPKRGDKS